MVLLPSQNDGGAAVAQAERAAGAMGTGMIALLPRHSGMRLAAQLARGFKHLGEPAAIAGMVAAQPAAIGVEGQRALARDQVAVGAQPNALALLGKAQILELH